MTQKKFYLYKNKFIENLRELQGNGERDFELLVLETTPKEKYKKYFPKTKHFFSYKFEECTIENGETIRKVVETNPNSKELMVYNAKTKRFEQIETIEVDGITYKRKYKINNAKTFGLEDIITKRDDPYKIVKIVTVNGNEFVGYIKFWKDTTNVENSLYMVNVKHDEEKQMIYLQLYYKKYIDYHYTLQMEKSVKTYVFNLETHQSYEYERLFKTIRKYDGSQENQPKQQTKEENVLNINEETPETLPFDDMDELTKKKKKQFPLNNISRGQKKFYVDQSMYPIVSYIEDIMIDNIEKQLGIRMSKRILFEDGKVNTSLIEYCNNGLGITTGTSKVTKDLEGNYNYGLQYLCKLNYNPLCPELVNYKGYFDNRFREFFKYDDPNQYNKFCELLKLPKAKKFKQYIRENGNLFYLYLLVRSIGITNIDAIYELFKIRDFKRQDVNIYPHMGFIFHGTRKHGQINFENIIKPHPHEKKIKYLDSFLVSHFDFLPFLKDVYEIKKRELFASNEKNKEKKLIKLQNTIVRRIHVLMDNADKPIRNGYYTTNLLRDVLPMYNRYRENIPEDIIMKMYDDGITMWIHDVLSKIARGLEYRNVDLTKCYTKNVKALERDYGEYSFKLPKESMDIINLSVDMENCVSSYVDVVIKQQAIVMGLYKNGKTVSCIHLLNGENIKKNTGYRVAGETIDKKTNKFFLEQFKLYGNIPCCGSKEIYRIAEQWVKDNSSIVGVSKDMENKDISFIRKDDEKHLSTLSNALPTNYKIEPISTMDEFQDEYDKNIISKHILKDVYYGYYVLVNVYKEDEYLGIVRFSFKRKGTQIAHPKALAEKQQECKLEEFISFLTAYGEEKLITEEKKI